MQSVSSRMWTRVAVSISCEDNHYTTGTSITVPIISFILKADSVFSTSIFTFHFRLVITEGWVFFTNGLRESRIIWKSHALPYSNSSTSDNSGSFSFVDELYSTTCVKGLGTLTHFFVYLLIVSTFVIDTSYTCIGHDYLGNKLATVVEGDPKAAFSIATTPKYRGGRYSIPWTAPLYPWSLPFNAEC